MGPFRQLPTLYRLLRTPLYCLELRSVAKMHFAKTIASILSAAIFFSSAVLSFDQAQVDLFDHPLTSCNDETLRNDVFFDPDGTCNVQLYDILGVRINSIDSSPGCTLLAFADSACAGSSVVDLTAKVADAEDCGNSEIGPLKSFKYTCIGPTTSIFAPGETGIIVSPPPATNIL